MQKYNNAIFNSNFNLFIYQKLDLLLIRILIRFEFFIRYSQGKLTYPRHLNNARFCKINNNKVRIVRYIDTTVSQWASIVEDSLL